jgi:2-methylisocitrate lyase-like PEP mutase family enzyme
MLAPLLKKPAVLMVPGVWDGLSAPLAAEGCQ